MSRLIDADALRKCFEVPHELKCGIQAGMDEYALKCIDEQPTVAVSPWHRVEDELPVKGEIVIVSDGKRTWDVGQYHCLVSSDDRTKWWWKGHTIKTVKWWMRKKDALPEPPKEE